MLNMLDTDGRSSMLPQPSVYMSPVYDEIAPCIGTVCQRLSKPIDPFEKALQDVETKRGSKVIFLTHGLNANTSTFSFLNFEESLTMRDAEAFVTMLNSVDSTCPIDLILHTYGGNLAAAEVIINAIRNHQAPVRIFIPHHAMSAGTLIALSGAQIHLNQNAFMGPIDPQYAFGMSINTVIEYAEKYEEISKGGFITECVNLLAASARKTHNRIKALIEKMPRASSPAEQSLIYNNLVKKYNHDQPLFFKDLSFLSDIESTMNEDLLELFTLYRNKPANNQRGALGLGL